ncbi:hypothetical protein Mgra_00009243 [Meloidogyne graminicola]|uniref:Uncharacterized protein n=1 Tax=Meloidogyne graminicola TaxID=189291 RepID=A0A8S9ZDI6_9BILA|nr:hypothetical protein Mgra_00009243 [Meloidogyne graminicola]
MFPEGLRSAHLLFCRHGMFWFARNATWLTKLRDMEKSQLKQQQQLLWGRPLNNFKFIEIFFSNIFARIKEIKF